MKDKSSISYSKKIFQILNIDEKKKILFLFFLITVNFFLEMISVTLVVPIVTLIFDDNFLNNVYLIKFLPDYFFNFSSNQLLKFSLIAIAGIYFVKTIFLIFFSYWKANFIYGLHKKYAEKLYFNYINQNYLFHLKSNSSELTKNIVSTQNFAHNINQLSILLTEIIILFGLTLILMYVNFKATIFIFIFTALVSFMFLRFVSPTLSTQGKKNMTNLKSLMESINSSFFAIKEIKIMNRENYFISKFSKNIKNFSNSEKIQEFIQSIPRFILEFMSILLLIITIFFMLYYEYDRVSIITFLALFAAVGFKIIPSINKIIFSIQHLKFYLPVSEVVITDLKLKKNQITNTPQNVSKNWRVQIKNLSYMYPKSKKFVFRNINLDIKKFDIIGITGPSGAGKSTFINCLIGLLNPSNGEINIDQQSIFDNLKSWQNKIGYVPQQVFLTDNNIFSNIAFGVETKKIDKNKIFQASKISQLSNFLKKKQDYFKIIGERGVRISGGQMQRVGIARALYNEKDILIFDESTSSLDLETEKKFFKSIENFKRKKTIIIISHKLNTLKICDKVFKLKNNSLFRIKL
jgi:ATP-binding cassette, subfamily B, bacterial PglK